MSRGQGEIPPGVKCTAGTPAPYLALATTGDRRRDLGGPLFCWQAGLAGSSWSFLLWHFLKITQQILSQLFYPPTEKGTTSAGTSGALKFCLGAIPSPLLRELPESEQLELCIGSVLRGVPVDMWSGLCKCKPWTRLSHLATNPNTHPSLSIYRPSPGNGRTDLQTGCPLLRPWQIVG